MIRLKQILGLNFTAFVAFLWLCTLAPETRSATAGLEPVVYTMNFPAPETHIAEIEVVIPTEKRQSIELMMPVWSPGYYGAGNYAKNVQDFAARTKEGAALA